MDKLVFRLDADPLPSGVAVVVGDNGEATVIIDPLVAFDLQGSKRQLAALRAERAQERQPWDRERAAMTETLMQVTMALSGMMEAYDWLINGPENGMTDEGRARLRMMFLSAVQAARTAIEQAGRVPVDWEEVVAGRKLPAEERATRGSGVWEAMARELAPMVNGPEGAALIRLLDELAAQDDGYHLDSASTDWLYDAYRRCVQAAGACRGLMGDPDSKETAVRFYRGFVAASLNLGRALALRQFALMPEPMVVKRDPYVQCADCLSPEKCEAERRCVRGGPRE